MPPRIPFASAISARNEISIAATFRSEQNPKNSFEARGKPRPAVIRESIVNASENSICECNQREERNQHRRHIPIGTEPQKFVRSSRETTSSRDSREHCECLREFHLRVQSARGTKSASPPHSAKDKGRRSFPWRRRPIRFQFFPDRVLRRSS